MSVIESVTTYVLEANLDEPWDFGIEPYMTSTCVVIEVTSDSGAIGYGEAIARKAPRVTALLVPELLAPLAIGRPVAHAGRLWVEMLDTLRRWGHHRGFLLEAIAGLDIALWDLRARELRVPVGHLLPTGSLDQVRTYASSIYFQPRIEDAVRLARATVDGGARALKIKVGHRPEQGGLQRDIETVRAIRGDLGAGVDLMLDANGTYRLAEARRVVEALAGADIVWFEEPFPPDDLDAYEALAACSPIPLAAGESEFSVFGFRDLIQRGGIGFAQPDVARCGGVTGTLQILDYCFAHHVPVCPHTGFSGGINNLVSMHIAATAYESGILEHMIIDNPLRDIFTQPLPEPEFGIVQVPRGEGFGRDIDTDKLHELATDIQYAASDTNSTTTTRSNKERAI